ncbi:cell cycle checkpoint control protein RAD9A [Diachasma alloeum]|uniref:cell cycle checkpoint control protein RAD9A n=1 Tax=Diachasma alloeum TaxID=454923 RepID=UPI0007382358|nr:cell cycle checkpoint control protein RAD9A [Diachasma alloeum]
MKCVIPCANVKVLARAFHALAKIGEEMYVMPQERSLSFRSVSMANSAYCDFTFGEHFFTYYNYGNLSEDDALKCKVPMRAAMAVFKTPGVLDKLIETCQIKLDPNAIKLMIILKYKNSVIKRFLLPIIDCEALQASYNTDTASNKIIAHPSILGNALHNFQQNLIEITLDVTADKILMRNYIDDTSSIANATRTQLALAIGEFTSYQIEKATCLTFCLKELRAILAFADIVGNPIRILFESAGKPAIFFLKSTAFEAHLVLSTLDPDNQYTPDTTIRDKRQVSKKRTVSKPKKPTVQKKREDTERSAKTAETVGNILASVHNKRDKDPFHLISRNQSDAATIDEPQLISAIRSTSIHSKTTTNNAGRFSSDVSSPQHHRTCQRSNSIVLLPDSESLIQSSTAITVAKRIPSIISIASKRGNRESDNRGDGDDNDDTIPASPPPPAKRAKIIFRKCFENTFDPKMLPGHDTLLANDSDEEKK